MASTLRAFAASICRIFLSPELPWTPAYCIGPINQGRLAALHGTSAAAPVAVAVTRRGAVVGEFSGRHGSAELRPGSTKQRWTLSRTPVDSGSDSEVRLRGELTRDFHQPTRTDWLNCSRTGTAPGRSAGLADPATGGVL